MGRYEEVCAAAPLGRARALQHRADVCDKHPRDKLAMVCEHYAATSARSRWGELQDLLEPVRQRAARARRRARRPGGDGAAADARDGGRVLRRPGSSARSCSRCRCSTATRASATGSRDSQPQGAGDRRRQRRRASSDLVERRARARRRAARRRAPTDVRRVDTAADDPAQLYYTSGTTGLAKGILHAHRYLLAHEEFVYCHDVQDGELFHGMGEWAWAAGIAPLLGPWRLGAVQCVYQREGGFDPAKQLAFLSQHRPRTSSRRRRRCGR